MAVMDRVQNKSRSVNYDSDSEIMQHKCPERELSGYIVAEKRIITDREYFGVRLAFMANSAFMEACCEKTMVFTGNDEG